MKPTLATTTLLLATLVATPALAGGQGQTTGFESFRSVAVDGAQAFGKSVAGDFTGDGRTDVAAIVDGQAVLLFGPDAYRGPALGGGSGALEVSILAPEGSPELVWDLALFEDVGADGVDALFTVGENGLIRWRYLNHAWERTVIAGGWVQARATLAAVATWEYESSGYTWVGVLEDDGRTVHALLFLRASGEYFSQVTPFTLASVPITSFALHNLDADLEPEILAVSADGLDVWNLDGTSPTSIFAWPAQVFATALDEPSTPVDRIAFVLESNDAAQLYVLDGTVLEPPLDLGDVDVHALAAGDRNGDGWDDLLVSTSGAERFTVFRNRRATDPSGPTFSAEDTVLLLEPNAAQLAVPDPVTQVLFADLEDDGDDDVVLWDDAQGRGLHFRADAIDAADFELVPSFEVQQPTGATFPLRVTVAAGAGGAPSGATHVEAIAWAVDANGDTLLVADAGGVLDLALDPLPEVLTLDLPVPPVVGFFYWSIELRWVADAVGEPRRAWPSGLDTLELEVTHGSGGGKGLATGAGVPQLRGTFLPLTDLPPFPADEVPLLPIPM